jgi:hypothetical protein
VPVYASLSDDQVARVARTVKRAVDGRMPKRQSVAVSR